jgi:hypothetical protein
LSTTTLSAAAGLATATLSATAGLASSATTLAAAALAATSTALRTKLLFRTSHSFTLRSVCHWQRKKQRMCHITTMQRAKSLRNSRHT